MSMVADRRDPRLLLMTEVAGRGEFGQRLGAIDHEEGCAPRVKHHERSTGRTESGRSQDVPSRVSRCVPRKHRRFDVSRLRGFAHRASRQPQNQDSALRASVLRAPIL